MSAGKRERKKNEDMQTQEKKSRKQTKKHKNKDCMTARRNQNTPNSNMQPRRTSRKEEKDMKN